MALRGLLLMIDAWGTEMFVRSATGFSRIDHDVIRDDGAGHTRGDLMHPSGTVEARVRVPEDWTATRKEPVDRSLLDSVC